MLTFAATGATSRQSGFLKSFPHHCRRWQQLGSTRHFSSILPSDIRAHLVENLRTLPSRHKPTAVCAHSWTLRNYATIPPRPPAWEARQSVYRARNRSLFMYTSSVIIFAIGVTYASVPLYRAFCSATGFGGTPMTGKGKFDPERLVPVTGAKRIKVHFNSDTSDSLPWSFTPQQKYIYVLPGETALAFYTAKNKSDQDLIGIATYNVTPDKIAPYFAKVECFCFEEQKLLAGEEVDLPLFFFIDKDFVDDPTMGDLDDIVLSYTFFRARRNKHGQLEPDASEDVVDKSMGWSNYTKAEPRENR